MKSVGRQDREGHQTRPGQGATIKGEQTRQRQQVTATSTYPFVLYFLYPNVGPRGVHVVIAA
eukprot:scaffold33440_cov18-Tisochrysis_lutea.AAC.4